MTKNVARTLHWFWPRAESVLYSEVKRLVALGLADATPEPGARGRDRLVYSITPAGRTALTEWLARPPSGGFSLDAEPLLRLHLAPYGTKEDLVGALHAAREQAEQLLRQGTVIALEFLEGRHQFQEQVHIRALLFDYLWSYGLTTFLWAEGSLEQVARWDSIEGADGSVRDAMALIADRLAELPPSWSADEDGASDVGAHGLR